MRRTTAMITPLAAWAYLVAATLAEMALASNYFPLKNATYTNSIIAVLAATQVFAVSLVYLRLKYETRGVLAVAGASLFFSVLAVVLFLASLGH
jgi:hypothetical protein